MDDWKVWHNDPQKAFSLCYDPMFELSEIMCTKPEEFLAFAEILEESGHYEKKATYLCHQYGTYSF